MATDITIVIPAYNEERRLPSTLDRLLDELPLEVGGDWEIVVADDGSLDGTAVAARDRASRGPVRVVSADRNVGKGAALLLGVRAARAPIVVFMDADLPVAPRDLPALIGAAGEADLVCGSRRLPEASFDPPQPAARRFGGSVFLASVAAMGFRAGSDPQCGVKVLRRESIALLAGQIRSTGFAFDVELITRFQRAGLRVVERPVHWRHVPGSSLRPVRDAARTLLELGRLRAELSRSSAAAMSVHGRQAP